MDEAQSPATRLLERLLARGESAHARGQARVPALTFAKAPEYAALGSLDEVERFHGQLADAQRAGAIVVEREPGNSQPAAVRLADLERLAAHLGVRSRRDRVEEAGRLLAPWVATNPVLEEVLERWALGKPVRGSGPEAATTLRDALWAIDRRHEDGHSERILRRESVRLFGDSKHIEKITGWLELVTTGELSNSGLGPDDIWGSLGLRREPQPMLVSGEGEVALADSALPLRGPYLGLPVDAVRSITTDAAYLLTIENLASFHDAARQRSRSNSAGLLVYTAGMPSPPWRALYRRLLADLRPGAAVYHWGDIDEGGFRIAATLAADARAEGRTLLPWSMEPSVLDSLPREPTHPTPAVLARMRHWAAAAGWEWIAQGLEATPLQLEQEALDPVLPAA